MQNIELSYPGYYLILIAAIAVFYALSLYIRSTKLKETKVWLPQLLGVLRFLSIFTILFLLLLPLIKSLITEKEKPIIVLAKDKSSSVELSTDSMLLNQLDLELDAIRKKLNDDYIWDAFYFGQKVEIENEDSLNALSTNISSALEYISDSYEDQNLGAVILVSDGIFNEGKNPIYSELELDVRIHTIALGDTVQKRDLSIKNVLHNRIAYLNDRFPVEVDIQAYNAKGSKTRVSINQRINGQNKTIASSTITIDKERFFKTVEFELKAEQTGNIKYTVALDAVNNENSLANNSRNIYIDVLDAGQKILLLANGAHPDIKAIKNIVSANINYEIEVLYADDVLPNVADYDLLIFHNLPSPEYGMAEVFESVEKNNIPALFIAGNGINKSQFNQRQNVLELTGESLGLNNATAVLNRDFNLFTISDALSGKIESFVPLKSPFGDYRMRETSRALLYQKIGSVDTPYPLLAYSNLNNRKQAVLAGEGIWRWSLMEYFDTEEQAITGELIRKSLQYITQKEDKRQFRAFASKRIYRENESISIDAQLYNDNYELINAPDAKLFVSNEDGDRFEYIFSRNDNYYISNIGRFPEGNYQFTASCQYNGKELKSGNSFSVRSIIKEAYDLTARHDILQKISNNTGGRMLYPEDLMQLDSLIAQNDEIKTVLYQRVQTRSLLDWQWLLGLIILLLSIEWFLRRYFGAY